MTIQNRMQQWISLLHYAIRWNAFESLFYQTIYIIHQIILFRAVSNFDYSQIGIIISSVYLTIPILNFGLDRSFTTYFKAYSSDRGAIRQIVFGQLLLQILINGIFLALMYYATKLFPALSFLKLAPGMFALVALMFLFESLKKSLKVVVQLYFMNKITALLEIFAISLYVTLFWLLYFFSTLELYQIALVPLCIESAISVTFLSYIISRIYFDMLSLDTPSVSDETPCTRDAWGSFLSSIKRQNHTNTPSTIGTRALIVEKTQFTGVPSFAEGKVSRDNTPTASTISASNILKNRFYIFTTQLSNLIFSSNLLIATIAYRFGLEQIAVIQLSKSAIAFLLFFFEKTFGITTGSFLSRVKAESLSVKQGAFDKASQPLYKTLFFVLLTLLIIYATYSIYHLHPCKLPTITNSFLFIIAVLMTSFFIPQEQFLIVEERTYYLFFINLLNGIIFYLLAINVLDLTLSLIFFISSRFISLIILDKLIESKIRIKIRYYHTIYIPLFVILLSLCILSLIIFYHCQK